MSNTVHGERGQAADGFEEAEKLQNRAVRFEAESYGQPVGCLL